MFILPVLNIDVLSVSRDSVSAVVWNELLDNAALLLFNGGTCILSSKFGASGKFDCWVISVVALEEPSESPSDSESILHRNFLKNTIFKSIKEVYTKCAAEIHICLVPQYKGKDVHECNSWGN